MHLHSGVQGSNSLGSTSGRCAFAGKDLVSEQEGTKTCIVPTSSRLGERGRTRAAKLAVECKYETASVSHS